MTRRSRLVGELAILAAVLLALAIAAFAAVRLFLPPRLLAVEIGPSLDNALGPLVLRQVEISQRVLSNPAVDAAFSTIMDRLRPALDQLAPGSPEVRIVVLDCPTINAFALPGGIICVCTGLMRSLDAFE